MRADEIKDCEQDCGLEADRAPKKQWIKASFYIGELTEAARYGHLAMPNVVVQCPCYDDGRRDKTCGGQSGFHVDEARPERWSRQRPFRVANRRYVPARKPTLGVARTSRRKVDLPNGGDGWKTAFPLWSMGVNRKP